MRKYWYFVLSFYSVFSSLNSNSQAHIISFEQESNLANVAVTEGVDISRSTDFPALGAYSCKAVFPDDGGTVYLNNINTSSRRNVEIIGLNYNEVLLYFIWTNQVAHISLIVEDSLSQSFSRQYTLKQGANHLQLPFSEAEKFDVKRIKSIGLRTEHANILYLDYITFDQYQPVLNKLGRWEVEYSTDIQTPHFPWGADLASGPIKSYSISPIFDGRGIVELAERLDLDMEVTTIGRNYGAEKYGFGDFYMRRSTGFERDSTTYNLAHKYIAEDMLFDPEYDVIIWPGLHKWESYASPIRKAIMERVEKGTGLVLLYPVGGNNSDLWDISPLKSADAYDAQKKIKDAEISTIPNELDKSKWEPTETHYITRGIAFEGTRSFETVLNSGNVITNLAKSEFLLHVDGNQVDHKVANIFFLQPRIWDDYDVTMYHFGPNPVPGPWKLLIKTEGTQCDNLGRLYTCKQ